LNNPYSPPKAVDSIIRTPVALSLRCLSIAAFACGFVAFMAYYGYPVFMTPRWYFGILPTLAFLACSLGLIALAGPWKPSSREAVSLGLLILGVAYPLICLGLAVALNETTEYGVFWLLPRILMFMSASITFWAGVKLVHGVSRGRRLASIGYGLGVLQCMTSIVDFLYTEWAA